MTISFTPGVSDPFVDAIQIAMAPEADRLTSAAVLGASPGNRGRVATSY